MAGEMATPPHHVLKACVGSHFPHRAAWAIPFMCMKYHNDMVAHALSWKSIHLARIELATFSVLG